MKQLGKRIKQVRQISGLTQQEFAKSLGTHPNTIGRWERGQAEPDLNSVSLLCSKQGISPYWLLNGEGPILEKDREVAIEVRPRMKGKDLRGYKLSEIRGGPSFDATMANLQSRLQEPLDDDPEDDSGDDKEEALLRRIRQLEDELAAAKAAELKAKDEALKAKDEAIKTQNVALQLMQTITKQDSQRLSIAVLEDLRRRGGYKDIPELLRALSKLFPADPPSVDDL